MRRDRFGLWVTLLVVGVAAAAFAIALQVLDDGQPDPPPSGGASSATTAPTTPTTPATTPAAPTTSAPGAIATPTWIAIVASERDKDEADDAAGAVAAAGHPAGVLRSDDYDTLKKGLWVAYSGPFGSAAEARSRVDALAEDGIAGAYVRCLGNASQCQGGAGDGDDD